MTDNTLTLNNGVAMPALGLGVYQSTPEQTVGAVETALHAGYRLIDTASGYFNERQVGEGIRRSGVDRSDVFVTSKLWVTDYGYDAALRGFDTSTAKLGLDYLDLYLLHWPLPADFEATVGAYRAAEQLLADGRVRAIGVCNFDAAHLDALAERTEITPAVNQVELHPIFTQRELQAADRERGIVTQAWSPIGGINLYSEDADPALNVLENDAVTAIASAHGKTPAQVVLRWHLQQGRSAIPKSVRPERIRENLDVLDFALSGQELATIDGLDRGLRGGPDGATFDPRSMGLVIDPV